MRFHTWNVGSLYSAGSLIFLLLAVILLLFIICRGLLMTVVKEISKYKLDLMGVQEVRCGRGVTELAGEYTFFFGRGNENHGLGTLFSLSLFS
jgi:hypothetical protein